MSDACKICHAPCNADLLPCNSLDEAYVCCEYKGDYVPPHGPTFADICLAQMLKGYLEQKQKAYP